MHATFCELFPGEGISMLPRHARHWWPLIEDVFNSEPVGREEVRIFNELVEHEELQCISIDALPSRSNRGSETCFRSAYVASASLLPHADLDSWCLSQD